MKKVFAILIFLTLAILAIFPVSAFASESSAPTTSATANLRLVNPQAITAIDNQLFVADNITENNSVVLCFDVSSTPQYLFSTSVEKPITNLAESNGKLVIMHADCANVYAVSSTQLTKEESNLDLAPDVADVTYGNVTFMGNQYPAQFYFGGEESKFFYDIVGGETTELIATPSPIACLEFEGYVYFMYADDKGVQCKRFNEGSGLALDTTKDNFNKNLTLNLTPKGLFACEVQTGTGTEKRLVAYSDRNFFYLTQKTDNSQYFFETALFNYSESNDCTVADACSNGSKVFVLNDKNEVEIFGQKQTEDGTYQFVAEEATIGTDTIKLSTLPQVSQFNGYTLAKSKGYPTNIVYKTQDDTHSIQTIQTDFSQTFVILNFDGAEELPFYYVLVGNRFGWVKKSDEVTVAENDEKIEIINTKPFDVTYKAKFLSAGTVNIYKLPVTLIADIPSTAETPIKDSFEQTLTTMQDAVILQRFEETTAQGTNEWYYVSYQRAGETRYGFIQCGNVGKFFTTSASEGIEYEDDMKVNASLFEGVKMYLTETMQDGEEIYDEKGSLMKLRSGAAIKAIKTNADGTATYVEITQGDTVHYGWIPTENLIGRHNVTTNAAVGLCILVAASFCALVLLLLFRHRNKHSDDYSEEE